MLPRRQRYVPISKVVLGDEEIGAAVDVLRSGNLREGPQCRAFEEEFARYVGAAHAVTTSSGTAALHVAYAALLQPGAEILVPAFTFFATASMALAVGAFPVFCDINPETLTLDVTDAARRITPRTRAIAPVHLFGNPADIPGIRELARTHDLAIIWDAAQAHGAQYDGQDVGSYSDAVCYSFYPSKNMTTGEGGMVCANSAELASQIRLVRSHGQSRKYWHVTMGYNFRMTDIEATIGRTQLHKLAGWVTKRRNNAAYLRERFAECPLLRVQREQPEGAHAYHQFSVLLEERVERDVLLTRLRRSGVECAIHYPTPLHRQPAFAEISRDLSLPVSEATSTRIVSLPVHPYLEEEDLEYVADQVLAALSRR